MPEFSLQTSENPFDKRPVDVGELLTGKPTAPGQDHLSEAMQGSVGMVGEEPSEFLNRTMTDREDDTIRNGVNRVVERFTNPDLRHECPNGQSHGLIADGTGTGKGYQAVLAAATMANKKGLPALVATRSDLVSGLHHDAERLGIDLEKAHVEVVAFEDLPRLAREAKSYAVLALDEAQDIARDQDLVEAVDSMKTDGVLHLTATPYIEANEAEYFMSRLSGQNPEVLGRFEKANLKNLPDVLKETNKEFFEQGAMVLREYPYYGESGGMKVHGMSSGQKREEKQVASVYSSAVYQAYTRGDAETVQTLSNQMVEELQAVSDRALVKHAADHIREELKAGRKVVFYGSAKEFQSQLSGERYESFLDALGKELSEGKPPVPFSKFSDPKGRESTGEKSARESANKQAIEDFTDGGSRKDASGRKLDHYVPSKTSVILLPHSQNAGHSTLNQNWKEAPEVSVVSAVPPSADAWLQEEGRGSRFNSKGPAKAYTIAMDSIADNIGVKKAASGMELIESTGSLAAMNHQKMRQDYDRQVEQIQSRAKTLEASQEKGRESKGRRSFPGTEKQKGGSSGKAGARDFSTHR